MEQFVEGVLSTKAVIEAQKRDVHKILISQKKRSRNLSYLIRIAREQNIEIEFCDVSELEKYTDSQSHGGVLALVSQRRYDTIKEMLSHDKPFIAVLEGIEDPFNFGYCLRSLYAAGCHGVIVTERNWSEVVNVVTKSSAGASEFINLYASEDLEASIKHLKEKGLVMYAANRADASSLYETQFNDALILAIGGEKRGLSKKVAALADHNIYIPYANDFRNAINGSSATAIVSFEIFRQRGKVNESK